MFRALIPFAVFAVALLSAPVQAHASPTPLDVEVHVLADDTTDAYTLVDGYDIQDVYVREGHFEDLGSGVIMRAYLYGGFAATPTAGQMVVQFDAIGPSGTITATATTTDGSTWISDLPLVEAEFGPIDDGVAGNQGYVQVLIPYSMLGADLGEEVGPFAVRTYADGDLRDLAPGGMPVPGTGGQAVNPADSTVVQAAINITGPAGYTTSTGKVTEQGWAVEVKNRITVVGQHIRAKVIDDGGWRIQGLDETGRPYEPGVHPMFTFTGTSGTEELVLAMMTDLGGYEEVRFLPSGAPAMTTGNTLTTTTTTTSAAAEESPGVPVVLIGVAVVFLAQRRRR